MVSQMKLHKLQLILEMSLRFTISIPKTSLIDTILTLIFLT